MPPVPDGGDPPLPCAPPVFGAPPAVCPAEPEVEPDGLVEPAVLLPCPAPDAGGVGQPCGCGGGASPPGAEVPPALPDCPPDWPPLVPADDPELPLLDDGEPELPDDGEPELPDVGADCPPPPLLGLDDPDGGVEGDGLGRPLGMELDVVVRQPPVHKAAAATSSALISDLFACMCLTSPVSGRVEVTATVLLPPAWMRRTADGSTVNANPTIGWSPRRPRPGR